MRQLLLDEPGKKGDHLVLAVIDEDFSGLLLELRQPVRQIRLWSAWPDLPGIETMRAPTATSSLKSLTVLAPSGGLLPRVPSA